MSIYSKTVNGYQFIGDDKTSGQVVGLDVPQPFEIKAVERSSTTTNIRVADQRVQLLTKPPDGSDLPAVSVGSFMGQESTLHLELVKDGITKEIGYRETGPEWSGNITDDKIAINTSDDSRAIIGQRYTDDQDSGITTSGQATIRVVQSQGSYHTHKEVLASKKIMLSVPGDRPDTGGSGGLTDPDSGTAPTPGEQASQDSGGSSTPTGDSSTPTSGSSTSPDRDTGEQASRTIALGPEVMVVGAIAALAARRYL